MDESKKEILEKEKIYHEKKKARTPIYIVIGVLIIYAFFFTSKLTIPQPITSEKDVTALGVEEEYTENRSVTLVSAEYSKDQEIMEIVLNLKNNNYDNVDTYYYALTVMNEKSSKIKIKEIFNEDLFTVIRLEGVKKNYREIEFMLAPKVGDINEISDEMTATVILNKYNVDTVNRINTSKTKTDYLQERLVGMVDQLKDRLERQEDKLQQLKTKKSSLEKEITDSEKEQKYMTAEEVQEMTERNQSNQDTILETDELIKKQQKKIEKTQREIKDAKEKAAALGGQ